MVVVGTGGRGSAVVRTNYPVTDGIIAGTTTQEGHKENLEADELAMENDEVGL